MKREERITTRVTVKMKQELEKIAKKEGMNISALLRNLITDLLDVYGE